MQKLYFLHFFHIAFYILHQWSRGMYFFQGHLFVPEMEIIKIINNNNKVVNEFALD